MSVVLITGCSTGIGRGLARVCAEAGDRVFATMRNPAKAGDLEELPGVTILALDVTSDESVSKTVDEVLRSAGRIDVLINNAGIDTLGAIEDVSFDRIRAIMETNFFGALKITRAALPAMRAQNSGTIVIVTSMASTFTGYGEGTHAASKARSKPLLKRSRSKPHAGELGSKSFDRAMSLPRSAGHRLRVPRHPRIHPIAI